MGSESVQVCSPVVKCIIIVMIVLKILILFIPLLLLAEASFKIGPFRRHPLPSIPWGSRTITTNSPADQREPKPSQYNPPYNVITDGRHTDTSRYYNTSLTSSPRAPLEFSTKSPEEEQTSPSVQVHPVYPGPTREPVSVDSATIPPNIATDSSVQIETSKLTFSNSPHLVYTDNRHHDTRPYHVPNPASSPWRPPEFPTLPSVDVNKSQVYGDGRHTDTGRYHNTPLTSIATAPLEFSTKSPIEEQTSPSVQVHPVYPGPTEKSVSVDSATITPNIATDSSVQIETSKSVLSNSPHLIYTVNRHQGSRPYHVPKRASNPWSPPEFPTLPSVDVNKSQVYADGKHTDSGRYHNTPLTSIATAPLEFSTKSPVEEQTSPSVQVHPVYPGPTEKSVSVDSATIPPNIATDSSVQIETSKSVLSNSPHLIYTVNRHQGSRPYHVPKRASNPWSPPEFPTLPSVDVNKSQVYADGRYTDTGRYHNTPLTSIATAPLEFSTKSPVEEQTSPSVQVHPVYPGPTEKSVSVDSATIPPNIATDSSVQIETSTPAHSNSLHLLYTDNRHQGTRPYHVPKSAPSPLRVPKFSTFQSSDVSEQQVYTNGRHTDTGRYHNTLLTSSPRAPLEFSTKSPVEEQTSPLVNVRSVSPDPTGKPVSVDSATIPPNIATDSSVQIETSKLVLSNSPHLIYTDNRHQGTTPYHVPKPAPSLWSPPKFPTPLPLQLGKQPVHVRSDSYLYQTPPPVTPEKPFVENVSAFPTTNISSFSVTDIPRISQPNKPQPMHAIQRGQNTEIGPFIRPPRSANQQTWNSIAENWIAQNITLQLEETAAPPESILHSFNCPQPYGYFKYSDQCDEYIECKNNVPLAFLCPAGLHFNPGVEWTEYPCDHPSKVQCNVEPTTPPSSTASQPENTQSPKVVTTPRPYNQQPDYVLCPQPHGYFKFSDHCGEYIECKNHIPLIFTCPDGLHFNPLVEWTEYPCDHPSNVLCDNEITPQPTPESTTGSPPPPITRPPPPPSTTRPPPPLTTRPPPLPTTRPPPPPAIVGGGSRLIKRPLPPSSPPTTRPPPTTTIWQTTPPPPTTLPPTTQPPNTLPPPPPSTEPPVVITPDANKQPNYDLCPQPHGYFKFSDQCDEYIECKNYIPLIFTCPDGLHFNPLAEWTEYPCDHPSKVQCNGEPVDPITPSTTEPPAATTTESLTTPQPGNELRDFKCPETNGYFKFNDECGEYIECKNDIPHIYACPDGLHFNVFANWTEYPCDHPANVQCNKEIDSKQSMENPNVTPRTNVGTAVTPQSTSITPYIPGFQGQEQGQYQDQNHDQDQDKDQDQDQDDVDTPSELLSLELYDFYCPEPNAYYSVASRCDTYVECKSDIAIQHFCPDGLHFNPKTQWPNFPCDYPSKVQCNTGLDIDGMNMSRTRPHVGKPGPAIITHRRSVVTPRPPIITHRPPVIIHQPNIVTLRPNAVTPRPNAVTLLSNTVTLRPNAVTPRPNIVTRQPNVVTTQSNTVTLRLNAVTHRPNAVPLLSNAVTLRRNAVTPRPNVVTPPSNAVPLLSNAVTLRRNAVTPRPNAVTPPSNAVKLRSNAVTSQPNAVTHRPNVISRQPNVITPRPHAVTPPPNVVTPQTIVTTSRSIVVTPHIPRLPKQPTVDPPVTKQLSNYSCPESDGFYSVAAKCDEYVECKSDVAIQHSCPDGLHFNPNAHWPDYPCGYPAEVKCRSGAVAQEPKPTVDCPHREGFFPTDSGDCGTYKVCHAGVATVKQCPAGLVFNFETDVCDWPSNVPQCNKVKALEGFDCPAAPASGLISKYRYGRSCKDFVACQDGQPRLLSCDAGKHFNQETESCVDADLIVDCDA